MKVIIPVLMAAYNNKNMVVGCLKMMLKMKGGFWCAKPIMVILWLEMWLYCGCPS